MKLPFLSWRISQQNIIGQRGYLYLMLVIVVGLLVAPALKAIHSWQTFVTLPDWNLELDCFSESAVATAVLKKHTEDLCAEYTTDLNSAYQQRDPEALALQRAKWIERFETELKQREALHLDHALEFKLFLLYKQSGRWKEFLECYLMLIRKTPGHH